MKIILSVLGYFIGTFLGLIILSLITSATDTDQMGSSFIFGNIMGIIGAIIGYKIPKKKNS